MYVEVQKTQQKKRGRTSKPDTVTFGPASLPLDISWDAFLASIAGVVGTKPDYLNVSSFQFRTAKSSTSKTLPVTNALGLKAVHKELVSKAKTGSEPFLCITMAEPRKAQVSYSSVSVPNIELLYFRAGNWLHRRREQPVQA